VIGRARLPVQALVLGARSPNSRLQRTAAALSRDSPNRFCRVRCLAPGQAWEGRTEHAVDRTGNPS